MSRRVRDKDVETRGARAALKARGKPYWRAIGLGLHLGYRKGRRGGVWVVRRYLGERAYKVETIALADDTEDADGTEILDFWQAQEAARNMRQGKIKAGATAVKDAVAAYLEHLQGRASWRDAKKRLEAFVLPEFGQKQVAELDADAIRKWHRGIAKQPARARTKPGAAQNYRKSDGDPEAARKRQASANSCLGLLKAALNYFWDERKLKCEREWLRIKAFKGVNVTRSRYLTLAEAKRLINASDPEFRVLVRAALETGARYQEFARLRVRDFNPDSGTLHIRKSKVHKDRHIVLTEEGQELFGNLAAERKESEVILGREWRTNDQQAPMVATCKRAKIEGASFHTLRHTWALAVMNGVPPFIVAKNLGHADITISLILRPTWLGKVRTTRSRRPDLQQPGMNVAPRTGCSPSIPARLLDGPHIWRPRG